MSRAELRWVVIASLAVLLFASAPVVYGWSQADSEHVFTGFLYNNEDSNAYLGRMRLGAEGAWLFHLFYTPEEHQPAMVYPLYLLLGKLAHFTGLSLVLTYHLARVIFGLGLLVTVYAFAARFTPDVATRRLAWALVAVGSGLGWLLVALRVATPTWLGAMPLDFWVPEAFAFLVLYGSPHLAVAELLLLWSMLWAVDSYEQRRLRLAIWAGLAAIGMALVVPFYAGVLAGALGAFLVAVFIAERRISWRMVGQTALVGAFVAPVLAYTGWVFSTNPAFRQWGAQNTILSPHPLHYVLGYLPLLIPAVPGAVLAIRRREPRWLLPVAWILILPVLLYAPFNLQRRMIAGAQVPLALLAAAGLVAWARGRTRTWRLDLIAWVALAALSNVLLVTGSLTEVRDRAMPAFRPTAEIAAMDWLAANAPKNSTVLIGHESGNLLPVRASVRVFLGHGPETLYHDDKVAELKQFYDLATPDAWRRDLLARYGIDYVFAGPAERALGGWDLSTADYLEPAFSAGGYAIWRVR